MHRRPTQDAPTVTVGMATTGRAWIAADTIRHMARLDDRPDRVVVSVAAAEDFDIDALGEMPFPVAVIAGPKGSSLQRNTIIETEGGTGIILFLDDDFLISDGYVAALRRLFTRHPDVVLATGHVLADGVRGPGFDHAEGLVILGAAGPSPDEPAPVEIYSGYGCNMAVRGTTLAAHGVCFDPDLPLYAWLEDLDFSRRMAGFGRVVEDRSLTGVHLATKVGRSSGRRLGYSQVANPIYLTRKGTLEAARARAMIARALLANSAKALRPEPWIDRAGRLSGNLLALRDMTRGRCRPDRVLDL